MDQIGKVGLIRQAKATYKLIDCKETQLKASLFACCKYVSIDKLPDELETNILIDFCQDKFKTFGIDELVLAFKNVAANEFTVDKDHYGTLSPSYLADVLDAYREWKDKVLGMENRKSLEPSPNVNRVDLEDCFTFIEKWSEKYGKLPYGANWSQAYDHAINENIIDPTDKDKDRIRKILITTGSGHLSTDDFSRACKKEFIQQHFEKKFNINRQTFRYEKA